MNTELNGLQTDEKAAQVKKFAMMREAYEKGEITFTRANRYQRKKPKTGHTWYLIEFKNDKEMIYDGAFEMTLEFEKYLKEKDQLPQYLIFQLTHQL